jgi:hypothetical protein
VHLVAVAVLTGLLVRLSLLGQKRVKVAVVAEEWLIRAIKQLEHLVFLEQQTLVVAVEVLVSMSLLVALAVLEL